MESVQGVPLGDHAVSIYGQDEVAKFLATVSAEGVPNIALIVSQTPVEEGRLAFGEFMMVKTKINLQQNSKVASLAVTPRLELAGFKGEVERWVQSGPYIDRINSIPFFRYNAYAGVHNAAVLGVREILELPPRISYAAFARDYASVQLLCRGRKAKGRVGVDIPEPVRRKLNGLMTIKAIAFAGEDGYPNVFPVFATSSRRTGEIRFKLTKYNSAISRVELPIKVAMNVLTPDLLLYQVKGELVAFEKSKGVQAGVVCVEQIYLSMPPLVGERIC